MGLFDSVWFECPGCGSSMEGQSKGGTCAMFNYKPDAVPVDVALDLDDTLFCSRCECRWNIIGLPPRDTVALTLVPVTPDCVP